MSRYSSDIEALGERLDKLLDSMPKEIEPATFKSVFRIFTFGFFEEYAQWKYEHPYLSKFLAVFRFFMFFAALIGVFWWVADTSAGRATGLESLRNRVGFAYYSVVWANKGVPSVDSLQVPPKRYSGTIERVVGDVLIIRYYDNGKAVKRLVRPANVVISDKAGFADWAKPYLLKGITVDFYNTTGKVSGHDVWNVVLWSKRVPINVQLVERGYGVPEKNPETEIVNQIFSQYYFQRARSG